MYSDNINLFNDYSKECNYKNMEVKKGEIYKPQVKAEPSNAKSIVKKIFNYIAEKKD